MGHATNQLTKPAIPITVSAEPARRVPRYAHATSISSYFVTKSRPGLKDIVQYLHQSVTGEAVSMPLVELHDSRVGLAQRALGLVLVRHHRVTTPGLLPEQQCVVQQVFIPVGIGRLRPAQHSLSAGGVY